MTTLLGSTISKQQKTALPTRPRVFQLPEPRGKSLRPTLPTFMTISRTPSTNKKSNVGVGNSMVNTAISALSNIFPAVNVITLGRILLVVKLLRGTIKQGPSFSRYTMTRDVAKVL